MNIPECIIYLCRILHRLLRAVQPLPAKLGVHAIRTMGDVTPKESATAAVVKLCARTAHRDGQKTELLDAKPRRRFRNRAKMF